MPYYPLCSHDMLSSSIPYELVSIAPQEVKTTNLNFEIIVIIFRVINPLMVCLMNIA